MAEQQYEYRVAPTFFTPTELRNDQYRLDDLFGGATDEGWIYDDFAVIDPSSALLIFRRPVDSQS
jgi:hypothetical protein